MWQDFKNAAFGKEFRVLSSFLLPTSNVNEHENHEGNIGDAQKTAEQRKGSPIFPKQTISR